MNNAGGPFMNFLSSRSGTPGTLGTKCLNGDSLGDIRFTGDNLDDQARVVTPYEALKKNRVNAIVMGRSLVKGNIKNNIKKLIDHLNKWSEV